MALLNKIAGGVLAAGLAFGAVAAPASAEDKLGYTVTLTGVSDYLFRGISFTNEDPAFQPYVELTYGQFYLGFWGSNIGQGDIGLGPWEVDYYFGYRPTTGPITWDFGALYYTYGDRANGGFADEADYVEFQAIGNYSPITNLTLTLKGYYVPDQDAASPETGTIEGVAAYALPQMGVFAPTLSAGVGYTEHSSNAFYNGALGTGYFLGDDAYTYWNVGMKVAVEKFFMDFRYWDTNVEVPVGGSDDNADARFVFSAGVTLP
jgi:uncharacterized protein (TIGR02001 family)